MSLPLLLLGSLALLTMAAACASRCRPSLDMELACCCLSMPGVHVKAFAWAFAAASARRSAQRRPHGGTRRRRRHGGRASSSPLLADGGSAGPA